MQNKKMLLKKLTGIILTLVICLSVCFVPMSGPVAAEGTTTQTPLYTFNFDNDGFSANGTVDGTKVSGAAYSIAPTTQKDGTQGKALKISLTNSANRAIAFNNGSEWFRLPAGYYYITYDYMFSDNPNNTAAPADNYVNFTLISAKNASFWSSSDYSGKQYSVYDARTTNDIVDFNKSKDTWYSRSSCVSINSDTYFGIRAASKYNVYIDNIKIYSADNAPTVTSQPEIYDFDTHDFSDGISENNTNRAVDGMTAKTYDCYNGAEFFQAATNSDSNAVYAANTSFSNVVNLENGKSRSNAATLSDTATVADAYSYSNAEQYPGLAGTGHNNVLRMGLDEYKGAVITINRAAVLNNGTVALSLKAGTYKIAFDYYAAGDLAGQKSSFLLVHNVNSAVYNASVAPKGYYLSAVDLGTEKEKIDTEIFNYNNNNITATEAGKWIHKEYVFSYSEDIESIGFQVGGLRSVSQGDRATEIFIDNVSVTAAVDPGNNTWNFDFGVNAEGGSIEKAGGGTYEIGACNVAADGTSGNVLKFGHTAAYHGDERSAAFLSGVSVKHLEPGVYNISFRYLFNPITGDATYNGHKESGYISATSGRIDFGGIKNISTFNGTKINQLNALYIIKENNLTADKQQGVWYTYNDRISVPDGGIDFGISSQLLLNTMYIDDLSLEPFESETFNFDTGFNKDMVIGYSNNGGKPIGGSGIYTIADGGTEQGNVLRMPADTEIYNGQARAIIFNNGKRQTRYGRGLYEVSFKYRYDLNNAPKDVAGWEDKTAKFKFVKFDESTVVNNTFSDWKMTSLTNIAESELTADGAWHEITRTYYLGVDDILFGLSAEWLHGVLDMDDIKIIKVECDYEKIVSDGTYTVEGNLIKMPNSYTWISEFLDTVKYGERMTVKTADGAVIENMDQPMATGYIVELNFCDIDTDQTVVTDTKYVVVPNDINGDGNVDVRDLIRLKKVAANDVSVANDSFANLGLYATAAGGTANAEAIASLRTYLLDAPSNTHIVTVSGNSISAYEIVKPTSCSSIWGEQVYRLARTVKKYTGYDIPVVTGTAVDDGKIIINNPDSSLAANSYEISVDGINLVVNGADDRAVLSAINYLIAEIEQGDAELGVHAGTVSNISYKLVYSDEFEGTELDTTVWGDYTANPDTRLSVFQIYDEATDKYITSAEGKEKTETEGNKVLQKDADGVSVADGKLNIPVSCSDTENYKTATYTTHQPVTENRLNYRYGLLEIRAKLPTFPATTALWCTGTGLEIDLVEGTQLSDGSYGYEFRANVHMPAPDGGRRIAHSYQRYSDRHYVTDVDLTADYHIYSVEWTPDVMKFAVDGEVFWTLDLNEFDPAGILATKTQYILMGGSYCSTVDNGTMMTNYINGAKAINEWVEKGNTMPSETSLMIDYIRLYQDETNTGNYFKIG